MVRMLLLLLLRADDDDDDDEDDEDKEGGKGRILNNKKLVFKVVIQFSSFQIKQSEIIEPHLHVGQILHSISYHPSE